MQRLINERNEGKEPRKRKRRNRRKWRRPTSQHARTANSRLYS